MASVTRLRRRFRFPDNYINTKLERWSPWRLRSNEFFFYNLLTLSHWHSGCTGHAVTAAVSITGPTGLFSDNYIEQNWNVALRHEVQRSKKKFELAESLALRLHCRGDVRIRLLKSQIFLFIFTPWVRSYIRVLVIKVWIESNPVES